MKKYLHINTKPGSEILGYPGPLTIEPDDIDDMGTVRIKLPDTYGSIQTYELDSSEYELIDLELSELFQQRAAAQALKSSNTHIMVSNDRTVLPAIKQTRLWSMEGHVLWFPYYVSDTGIIFNRNLQPLKSWLRGTRGTQYRKVRLGKKTVSINRVVASTFHFEDYELGFEVDHINGNSHDDRACNLRWVSRSENEINKHNLRKGGTTL